MTTRALLLGSAETRVRGAYFDGSTYITRGANLTGLAASKMATFVMWLRPDDPTPGAIDRVFSSNAAGINFNIETDGDGNVADQGGSILSATTTTELSAAAWTCVLCSFDLSDTAKRHLYYGDVSTAPTWSTYVNTEIPFQNATNWSVGGTTAGAALYSGGVAEFWLKTGVYIDFSVEANRRKFITASGDPQILGANGSAPLSGTLPDVYLSIPYYSAATAFLTNRGSGGNYTVAAGALTLTADNP